MTTFQIVSDLHIEYKNNEVPDPLSFITPSSDILILAGDIGSFYKIIQLTQFLIKLCKYFQIVIYVPGNNEYYTQKDIPPCRMNFLFKRFTNIQYTIKNLYILNKSSIEINNLYIVGCTLWSNPTINVPRFIVRIKEMNTVYYKKKFNEELSYIIDMIEYSKKNNKKLIVVTHYMPTYSVFQNIHTKNKYISLYTSNLDYLLTKENVHTWIAGHIHINVDTITDGGTHLVGNQFGKPKDYIKDYDMKKIIKV
jgi:predicted phosphodiesterase